MLDDPGTFLLRQPRSVVSLGVNFFLFPFISHCKFFSTHPHSHWVSAQRQRQQVLDILLSCLSHHHLGLQVPARLGSHAIPPLPLLLLPPHHED